ncbi:phage tail protein [Massilia oculi]|uniref:Phage tail protein n=1 Tax=Massilia hydrophila TaxID=3044279 RepID=A0ABS7YGT5_9BURK|nr:phage tail protein [Massilia oculi]MCA1857454.1 phage tail protein [Massilia oculi]
MAVQLPNGITWALAASYAAAISVSAASNATEAVLTTANNTYAVGDIVEFTSGWTRATNRVFRVKTATATSVTLEGFDTTSTTLFPVGAGAGSVRKVMTWTPITQVVNATSSGGETQYTTYSFLESDSETQIPSGTSAQSLDFEIGDDPSLPHHNALKAAAASRAITAARGLLPSGSVIYYNGIWSYDETPTMSKGQIMTVRAGYALQGKPVRYAS